MSNKKRLLLFGLILAGVLGGAFVIIKLAQGYRPDFSDKTLKPTGLLVAKSFPEGAQLWLDGKLKSATNTTLNLSPGEYEVEIKKDGFTSWKKTLQIKKELVTEADAHLFSTYPDLKALTFTGAAAPLLSPDGQKVVFAVTGASAGKNGLWVLELSDRPLGLSREPRQIIASAPGGRDFAQANYQWSPDSKQILITLKDRPGTPDRVIEENFLLEADKLNLAINLIEVSDQMETIWEQWEKERQVRQEAQLKKLPEPLTEALNQTINNLLFSPDESKIFYTATASATIPKEILKPLPAASTQPESRQIEPGKVYVYDLKEDKNFYIMEEPEETKEQKNLKTKELENEETEKSKESSSVSQSFSAARPEALRWFPTSKHLFLVQNDKISIIEYDGTNWLDVYTGPFENSFAFPFPDARRILVLTAIGKDTPANLYAISLR